METAESRVNRLFVARAGKLSRRFGERRVLDSLDLDIAPGEFVAMLGRSGSGSGSGSGKSTLLRALAGLDREVSGQLEVNGTVAVAFQDSRLVPWKRVLGTCDLGCGSRSLRRWLEPRSRRSDSATIRTRGR